MAKKGIPNIQNIGQILTDLVKQQKNVTENIEKANLAMIGFFSNFSKQLKDATGKQLKEGEKLNTHQKLKNVLFEKGNKDLKSNIDLTKLSTDQIAKQAGATEASGLAMGEMGEAMAALGPEAAIAGAAIVGFTFVMNELIKLYGVFIEIQKRYTESMGRIAQTTGASSRQLEMYRATLTSLRGTFAELDEDVTGIQGSAEFVARLAPALRMSTEQFRDMAPAMLEVSRGFGVGEENAALLYRTIANGARDPQRVIRAFGADMMRFSEDIGANSGQVVQDFINSRASIASFGRDGQRVFKNVMLEANQFGFEAQKIFDMMKGFDTFSGAADNVNKLNAMFGTSLNSLELMEEQDPAKRLDMIRNELRGAGFDFQHMSRQQIQMLSQVTGQSEDIIQRVFGQGRSLAQLQREQQRAASERAKQEHQAISNQQMMNSLLSRTAVVFDTVQREFDRLFVGLSEDLGPIFQVIHEVALGLAKDFRNWVKTVTQSPDFKNTILDIAQAIRDGARWLKEHSPAWEQIKTVAKETATVVKDIWRSFETAGVLIETVFDMFALGYREIFKPMLGGIQEFGKLVYDEIAAPFKLVIDLLKQVAHFLGLDGPINAGAQSVSRTITEAISPFRQFANDTMSIVEGESHTQQRIRDIWAEPTRQSAQPNDINKRAGMSMLQEQGGATQTAPVTEATTAAKTARSREEVRITVADVHLDGRKVGQAHIETAIGGRN